MALGAPSRPPYKAIATGDGEWLVIQPENFGRTICRLVGENAASNAHFIANACNACDLFLLASNMALLALGSDCIEEAEALKEAKAVAYGEQIGEGI